MSKNHSNNEKTAFGFSEMAMFSGIVRQKLPSIQFLVELTNFPDGSPITQVINVTASLTGRMRSKSIKIATSDYVTVGISMESAPFKSGIISYRDKIKPKRHDFEINIQNNNTNNTNSNINPEITQGQDKVK